MRNPPTWKLLGLPFKCTIVGESSRIEWVTGVHKRLIAVLKKSSVAGGARLPVVGQEDERKRAG